jgi:predicted GTPase
MDQPKSLIVDTPGLGDAGGKDAQHIAGMVVRLKQIRYVNGFLIVFNG